MELGSFSVVGFLIAAVVLAGCIAGSEGSGPAAAAGGPAAAPAFNETTGSIQGVVTDEEIHPLANAQIGIVGSTLSTLTDDSGGYTLNYVPVGRVQVAALALGYEAAVRPVEVAAGELSRVDFILVQLAPTGPYSISEIYKLVVGGTMIKATPDCMYASQYGLPVSSSSAKTCQGTLSCQSGPCEVGYGHCDEGGNYGKYGCSLTNEWKTIVGEVSWQPQTSVNGRGWSWEILAPNVTRGNAVGGHSGGVDQSDLHDWWVLSSSNPIQTRIDRATALEGSPSGTAGNHPMVEEDLCGGAEANGIAPGGCDWHWRIFPGWCTINALTGGLAGCEKTGPDFALDQAGVPVTIYFSYSIREELPLGFTAVPDA